MNGRTGPVAVAVAAVVVAAFAGPGLLPDTLNFVGAELLGRPTNRSVTINVVPKTEIEVRFEYGTDTAYGSLTPAETTAADVPYEVVLDGLLPDTRYYYRMRYRVLASGDSLLGPGRRSRPRKRPSQYCVPLSPFPARALGRKRSPARGQAETGGATGREGRH